MSNPTPHQKYTARVRRGFNILLIQGLEKNIAAFKIRNAAMGRNENYTAEEIRDLDACLAYIKQEAQPAPVMGGEKEEPGLPLEDPAHNAPQRAPTSNPSDPGKAADCPTEELR